jgi:hypothetical protein
MEISVQFRHNEYLKAVVKPVMIHLNSHPWKQPRLEAAEQFFVSGNRTALDPFPDGSE